MVLDFVKDDSFNDGPMDTVMIKETLSWLNSLLCDRKREVKTIEDGIRLLETVLKKEERRR